MCCFAPLDWTSMSSVPDSLNEVVRGSHLLGGPQDPYDQGQGQEAEEVQMNGQSHHLVA